MERRSKDQGLPYAVGKEKDKLKIFAAEFWEAVGTSVETQGATFNGVHKGLQLPWLSGLQPADTLLYRGI